MSHAQEPVEIVEGCADGPARLVDMHARYYSREWGFGDYFRDKVAGDVAELQRRLPHPDCRIWFARRAGQVVGSIAIDGREAAAHGAHLRWFIVDDSARGTGAGARLIDTALAFCADRGFPSVYLWTFAGLHSARRLYEARGFALVEETEAATWGAPVREQRFVRVTPP